MTSIFRIGIVLALSVFPTLGLAAASAADRPNILFIITDDQDIAELGYLQGKALTPNIDRLATGGIRFNRAYVATSICTPSRYSCLTGQYASRSRSEWFQREITEEGVTRVLWNIGLAPDQPTLPKVLRAEGYRTGFVGKWHIGGMRGMQVVPKGADPSTPEVRTVLEQNQQRAAEILRDYGFDFAKSIYMGNPNDDRSLVNCGMNVHNMEWLTQAGLEFLDESRDEPFFLYFSTTLTHVPRPLDSLRGDPRASGIGLLDEPISGVQPSRESVMRRCREAGIPEDLWEATWLDDGIGALVNRLAKDGLLENTLIFYFVDNGMAEHSKGTCYEGGLIVPTFVYWKGKVAPASSDAMIQNIDFVPTILEAAGVTPPREMVIDGTSFLPLLQGEPYKGRSSVYSEVGLVRAVSTAEWKYIAFHLPPSLKGRGLFYQMGMQPGGHPFEIGQYEHGGPWKPNYFDADQLYHLKEDPHETRNLADDPKYAGKLAEMQALLSEYLERLPGTYPGLKE